jgi:hypothetical protein
MEFPKTELQELLQGDSETLIEVSNTIIDHSRWSVHYELIFKDQEGRYFRTSYSKGATEYQDESPFEYDKAMIECTQVKQQFVKVATWVLFDALSTPSCPTCGAQSVAV